MASRIGKRGRATLQRRICTIIVLEEGKKEKRKRKEEENVVRDTGSAPPYRTVLVPYSPVLKASGNLGAKPLEITLGFAVLGTTNDGWNRRVLEYRS